MVNVDTGDSRNKEKIDWFPAVYFHMVNVDTPDSSNKEKINCTLYIHQCFEGKQALAYMNASPIISATKPILACKQRLKHLSNRPEN